MALKRQQDMLATFSMASMTDVIFLLLVFFMVTSTYIFPTAIEVNLPEGTEQTPEKPTTRVFINAEGAYYLSIADADLEPVAVDSLVIRLQDWHAANPDEGIAVYADTAVAYGKVVEVLNMGAANSLKMVLATRPGDTQQPEVAAQPSIESQQ
jgi:biopolymer transport protein ExbD